jgi:hypothetical protein
MDANGYAVIFNISREVYTDWALALVILLPAAAGVAGATFGFYEVWKRALSACFAVIALAFFAVFLWFEWSNYQRLQSDYREGRYEVVDGPVRFFQRDYANGDSPQTFEVQSRTFELWHSRGSPAFHRTVGAGGPDLRGQCVRIAYSDRNEILWLGLRACASGER